MTVDENGNIHEYGATKEEFDRLYAYLDKMRSEKKDEEEKEVDVWEDGLPEEAWERLFKGLLNPTPAPKSVIDSLRRVLKTTSLGEPLPVFKKSKKLSIFPKDTGKPLQFTDVQKSVFQNFIGNAVCWRDNDGKGIDGGKVAKVEIDDDGNLNIGYEEEGDELWPILITPDDVKDIVINNEGVFINTEKYQYIFS